MPVAKSGVAQLSARSPDDQKGILRTVVPSGTGYAEQNSQYLYGTCCYCGYSQPSELYIAVRTFA